MNSPRRWLWAGCILPAMGPLPAWAANCALRNPDRQIFEIFPEATNYRTMVANVDETVKPAIEADLGSSVTFNDLAKHTIYVVLKNDVPVGLVHPRSEIGKRGSVELVWALDLDFRIRDFQVQRCRESHDEAIKAEGFRQALAGRDYLDMRALMLDSNTRVDGGKLPAPANAESIVHTSVLCGAKTLIITRIAFGEQLWPMRLLGNAHRFFPGTAKVTRLKLGQATGSADGMTATRSFGRDGKLLGSVVFCRWTARDHAPELWWVVGPEGSIEQVICVGPADDSVRSSAAALRGKTRDALGGRSGMQPGTLEGFAEQVLSVLPPGQ